MDSFRMLLENNRQFEPLFPDINGPEVTAFGQICCDFASSLSYEEIRSFRHEYDVDTLTIMTRDELLDPFEEYFSSHQASVCPPLQIGRIEAYISVFHEVIVRAIRREEIHGDNKFPWISIGTLVRVFYDVHLTMLHIETKHEGADSQEQLEEQIRQYSERRNTNLSIDADKESRTHLAPADKVRVLRNAVNAFNEVGYLDKLVLGDISRVEVVKDILTFRKRDHEYARAFFKANRGVTVQDVMMLAETCAEASLRYALEGFDPHYHSRRGIDIGYLLRNTEKIVSEQGTDAHILYSLKIIARPKI